MKEMMKNMDFYVTPVLNIDGYMYSWKDNTVSRVLMDFRWVALKVQMAGLVTGIREIIRVLKVGSVKSFSDHNGIMSQQQLEDPFYSQVGIWCITEFIQTDWTFWSFQTRLWRKSRSPGPSAGCYGTDLNRNFDSNWGSEYWKLLGLRQIANGVCKRVSKMSLNICNGSQFSPCE